MQGLKQVLKSMPRMDPQMDRDVWNKGNFTGGCAKPPPPPNLGKYMLKSNKWDTAAKVRALPCCN